MAGTSSLDKLKRLSTELKTIGQPNTRLGAVVNHSQFAKNVSLRLYTDGRIEGNLDDRNQFTFPINPEEFVVSRAERVQVVQTLGEPFIDEFGKGLPSLNIRGTTGWRVHPINNQNIDGHEAFRRLHRDFIDRYFSERQDKQDAGLDPDDVKLVIINSVDDLAYQVVPQNFRLLRSKSKPLLYQYDITFVIVADLNDIDQTGWRGSFLDVSPGSRNWLSALTERVGPIVDKLEVFASPVWKAVGNFIDQGVAVLSNAKSGVGDIANFLSGVTNTIKLTLDATRDTQAFINNLPLEAILELNELTTAIGEFNCYLKNGITESWLPDFSGVCGVTDCATTHGVPTGTIAASPNNAIEWVVALNEAARSSGSGAVIGIRHTEQHLYSAFEDPDAAIVMESSLDEKMSNLGNITRDTSLVDGVDDVYSSIVDTLGDIQMDATKLAGTETDESLKKISQLKMVTAKEGDTLQSIAFREYGDWSRWHELAAVNDVIIEEADDVIVPFTSFTVDSNLYAGNRTLKLDLVVPASYAQTKCLLTLKDVNGRWQTMRVQEVSGDTITFYETYSQTLTGPITVVRQMDLVSLGVFDSCVALASDFLTGKRDLYLTESKDVYPGYKLFIVGASESRSFTVKSVSYLDHHVVTVEPSIGFVGGDKVGVYNTETSRRHLVPGTQIKVPVTSGDTGNVIQTANEVYGSDLGLDQQGNLALSNGDISIVSGLDNIKQAIQHRITSHYKSLMIHPEYGCGLMAILGDKNTSAVRTLAKATLVEAINREPRLDNIVGLSVTSVGDAIKFSVEVESIETNTTTDLNFVIGGK